MVLQISDKFGARSFIISENYPIQILSKGSSSSKYFIIHLFVIQGYPSQHGHMLFINLQNILLF